MNNRKIIWEKWSEQKLNEDNDHDLNINMPVLYTPYGFITHKLFAKSKNDRKFYVGNTNFDLSTEIIDVINNTWGVEVLSIFSPYMFRFAIGKAFKTKEVIKAIEARLYANTEKLDNEAYHNLQALQYKLDKNKKPWLIYVLPNGKFESYQEDNPQFMETLNQYREVQKIFSGNVLTSIGV